MSELEFRGAEHGVEVSEVSFPKRLIELIVMPYETETTVAEHGKLFTEICSRGAFDGVQQRTSQIKVNLDHDSRQVIGRTVALHPSRQEGLVAEIRITRAPEGESILIKADEGLLDASAGFRLMNEGGKIKPGAEVWETRDRRRLNHLYLDHVALVGNPAYADARVLAVRAADSHADGQEGPGRTPTPNRDLLELQRLRTLYADIDRRYGLTR